MYTQKTIKKAVSCSGVGLHSGNHIDLTFKPARVDSGIVFTRTDISGHPTIRAIPQNITDVTYATTLGRDGVTIQTVEHMLSAVNALGITNLEIEVAGSEAPVLDGSAACFMSMLLDAGLESQRGSVRAIRIMHLVEVRGKDCIMSVEPYDGLKLTYTIDFPNPFIGVQTRTFEFHPALYEKEIAHARTFCQYEEIEYLWKMGLSKGGSLDNAVVFAQDRILNDHLRYDDEPVRHKILDLMGDLIYFGHPLLGHVKVYKGGHKLHTKFVKTVLANPDLWMYVTGHNEPQQIPDRESVEMLPVDEAPAYQHATVFA